MHPEHRDAPTVISLKNVGHNHEHNSMSLTDGLVIRTEVGEDKGTKERQMNECTLQRSSFCHLTDITDSDIRNAATSSQTAIASKRT